MYSVNIYSPSQTDTWSRCPRLRALSRDWARRQLGRRELAGILGTAIADGLAAYNRARLASSANQLLGAPTYRARLSVERQLSELHARGHVIAPWDQAQAHAIPERAAKMVAYYVSHDPFPPEWEVLGVEWELGPERARLDLALRDDLGPLVVDYKTKLSVKPAFIEKELQRWAHSWQQKHYLWRLSEHLGEPVRRYAICLLIVEPKPAIEVVPYSVSEDEMARWEASARQVWSDMAAEDAGERLAVEATRHADEYGECEFVRACFEYQRADGLFDQTMMAREFVAREKQ